MRNKIFISISILIIICILITSVLVYNILKINAYIYMRNANLTPSNIDVIDDYVIKSKDEIIVYLFLVITLMALFTYLITNYILKNIYKEYAEKKEIEILELNVKQKEDKILNLTKVIDKEMLKMKNAYDKMYEGIIVLDMKKRVVHINKSAKELLSIDKEHDFTNKNVKSAISNDIINSQFDEALNNIKTSKTIRLNNKYLKTYVNPIIEDDQFQGLFALVVDDTLLYEQENERRRFTANITHELKTPLTSITGYAEIMKNMSVGKEEVQEFSQKIIKNTKNMTDMINDIIKLSSLEELGKVKKKDIKMDKVVKSCIKIQEIQAQIKQVEIIKDIEKDIFINANENMIFDMVSNILSNAIKYNKENGIVNISLKKTDKNIVFTVQDTGIGIPEKYKDKVFEKFFVADESRSKLLGGSGLGLSIVKHIAKVHNASIDFESEENKGTKFKVLFEI